MKKTKTREVGCGIVVFVVGLFAVLLSSQAYASVDKVTWCHCEPSGGCQTLELPQQALEQAGHVDAQGNALHENDHAGACVVPTATPSLTPSLTPTLTLSSTPTVTPTPTSGPTGSTGATGVIDPTPTPTVFVGSGTGDGLSDGKSDGRSDGKSSSPEPTLPPCKPGVCGYK